ncbi:MAG: hypothetical protein ACHQ2E_05620 [Gemmatimonadales bacterium]
MLKPVLAVGATGIIALLLWKALAILLLPLFGIALGMVIMLFKIILLAGVLLLSIWIFRRLNRSATTTG